MNDSSNLEQRRVLAAALRAGAGRLTDRLTLDGRRVRRWTSPDGSIDLTIITAVAR